MPRPRARNARPEVMMSRSLVMTPEEMAGKDHADALKEWEEQERLEADRAKYDVTTVYRIYAADNELLYVGITGLGISRLHQHAKGPAHWWRFAHHAEFEHFASRKKAEARERKLILELNPSYNIQHALGSRAYNLDSLSALRYRERKEGGPPLVSEEELREAREAQKRRQGRA